MTRVLLLQVRNADDPIRRQEVACFARTLDIEPDSLGVLDLLTERLNVDRLRKVDLVVIGGSGDYSAAADLEKAPWLERTLTDLRTLHGSGTPVFASCWGFQAMARAMGGLVVHDPARAELGTIELKLTEAGRTDPVFGPLGSPFRGHAGHEDRVVRLPERAVLLATSALVPCQAYRFEDAPVYATQFHPEMTVADLRERVRRYPRYAEEVAGISIEEFEQTIHETPATNALIGRFANTSSLG